MKKIESFRNEFKTTFRGLGEGIFGKGDSDTKDSVRRQYYNKILLICALILACGIFAVVFLRQWQMLLVCVLFCVGLFCLMLQYEYRYQHNEFTYVYAKCTDKSTKDQDKTFTQIKMKVAGNQIKWEYQFEGKTANGKECGFTITRSQQSGFEKDGNYFFTFRAKDVDDLNENTLITFEAVTPTAVNEQVEKEKQRNKRKEGLAALRGDRGGE